MLSWTDLVSSYIPEFVLMDEFADARCTIADLLAHVRVALGAVHAAAPHAGCYVFVCDHLSCCPPPHPIPATSHCYVPLRSHRRPCMVLDLALACRRRVCLGTTFCGRSPLLFASSLAPHNRLLLTPSAPDPVLSPRQDYAAPHPRDWGQCVPLSPLPSELRLPHPVGVQQLDGCHGRPCGSDGGKHHVGSGAREEMTGGGGGNGAGESPPPNARAIVPHALCPMMIPGSSRGLLVVIAPPSVRHCSCHLFCRVCWELRGVPAGHGPNSDPSEHDLHVYQCHGRCGDR